MTKTKSTRTTAKNAFYELRRQAANVPEMALDEINTEISAARIEKRQLTRPTLRKQKQDFPL